MASVSTVNLPAPKQIEPAKWRASKHAYSDILFDAANPIVLARRSSLKGLHAVCPRSNLRKDDKTPQPISTLAKPVQPIGYRYVQGPEVSINYVSVKIGENKFGIPEGDYVVINRANRTPMKDKGKKDTYEFPGRVWKNSGDAAMDNEADRQKVLLTSELGMTKGETEQVEVKPLIHNLAPAAGNTSMLQRLSAVEIPQSVIVRLIDKYGAKYQDGVVKIARKSDGGIIQGIEMIPKAKVKDYLAKKVEQGNVVATSTYAALGLAA